jgi:hypothetical protein
VSRVAMVRGRAHSDAKWQVVMSRMRTVPPRTQHRYRTNQARRLSCRRVGRWSLERLRYGIIIGWPTGSEDASVALFNRLYPVAAARPLVAMASSRDAGQGPPRLGHLSGSSTVHHRVWPVPPLKGVLKVRDSARESSMPSTGCER